MKRENLAKIQNIIGIDEAGRGPLAGPVAVGAVCIPKGFTWKLIPGVGDSKKVSPKNREAIFKIAEALKREGFLNFHVALVSEKKIDKINISRAVGEGIVTCFKKLNPDPTVTEVKLDGLLKAPKEYVNQKTIIKGDAKERVIGLASILAKVTRDRYMERIGKKYPKYGFEIHKGYGTKMHREAISRYGLLSLHRKTFCKNVK